MKEAKVLRKNPNFVTRVIDEEPILIPLFRTSNEIDYIYTLNSSARQVWDLIDGKKTISQIKERLLKNFDSSSEEVDKGLTDLLQELRQIKAIV